ncbi:MAG: hypothetical protein QNJ30_00870 [Kiloniellales bacterium]|nr:hypothetical protein [Kiloniellales bacterium]
MRAKAFVLASLLLALPGCELLGMESESADSPAGAALPEGTGAGFETSDSELQANLNEDLLVVLPPPPGPPPRKPLVGISLLPSKSDHEGLEALRTYEAVKLTEDNLIGIEPVDAMGLLGVPEQIREDPPAQVWAYRREGCRLEIYFYLDLESDNLRSLTYELEAGEPSEAARQACLTRLLTPEGDHG